MGFHMHCIAKDDDLSDFALGRHQQLGHAMQCA